MERRILIVEDNVIFALDLQEWLTLQGTNVHLLTTGAEFIETVSSFRPDLILLDLRLPDCTGFELLEQLHQSEWAAIPVIIISAFTLPSYQQQAQALGAKDFLHKPVSYETIDSAIEKHLA